MVNRAKKLCSTGKVAAEIETIKKFASYNGFPRWIVKNVIQQTQNKRRTNEPDQDDDVTTLYMSLPFSGKEAESIVKRSKRRLMKLFKKEENVKFSIFFESTKISFFTSNKDKIPDLSNSKCHLSVLLRRMWSGICRKNRNHPVQSDERARLVTEG